VSFRRSLVDGVLRRRDTAVMRTTVPINLLAKSLVVAACAAAAVPVLGASSEASAASCSSFSYRAKLSHERIKVSKVVVSGVGCSSAKKKISLGEFAASTYSWIPGYRCGPAYTNRGYICKRGSRTIKFLAKI
jgi:thioredoxin reductase